MTAGYGLGRTGRLRQSAFCCCFCVLASAGTLAGWCWRPVLVPIDPGAGAGAGSGQQLLSVLVSMLVLVSVLVSVSSSRVGEDTEPTYSKEPCDALPDMVEKEGASQALYPAGCKCSGVQVLQGASAAVCMCSVGCMCSRV